MKDNKALNDLDQEFNLFMHSQVPEVEPEDTDTIHPDYKGIPMVANIPFKEPGPEAYDPLPHLTEEGKRVLSEMRAGTYHHYESPPKEQVYLGIDPGKSGGIVVLTSTGVVVDKFIMPILGDNLDVAKLYDLFTDLHRRFNITVVLEDVHSIFGMSAATNFVFGYVCGAIEAVVLCLKLKLVKVPPKTWQKEIWSNGDKVYKPKKENQKNPSIDTKPTSLCSATRLFPTVDLRKSSKAKIAADGLVDALLLAEYGRRKNL